MKNANYYTAIISLIILGVGLVAQNLAGQTTDMKPSLIGRWEVLTYAEQGVPVDKKQPGKPQALNVYRHVRAERARIWYGYDADDEQSRKRMRSYERWEERDSTEEVARVAEAIETPYFAVFFADSTLSLYNKTEVTNEILFPEARRYIFSPATNSIDIFTTGAFGYIQWNAQILRLTDTEMTLFLPEEAEVVHLVKTVFKLP